jgi:hypothetical protein
MAKLPIIMPICNLFAPVEARKTGSVGNIDVRLDQNNKPDVNNMTRLRRKFELKVSEAFTADTVSS